MLYPERWYQKLKFYAVNKITENISLSFSSTMSIKGKKTERLKNCNGEIASGFALLACRFTIQGMGMDFSKTQLGCLKSPTNISL